MRWVSLIVAKPRGRCFFRAPGRYRHVCSRSGRRGAHGAARWRLAEMLMAGTTTCARMSLHSEWVAKAAEASGIHAQISVPVSDDHNAWTHGAQQALDRALAMHDADAHHPRIGIAIGLPDLSKIDHATLVKVAT